MKLAKDTRAKRDSKHYKFNLEGINIDHILSLNVVELREGLIKGDFTSVQLVRVFGD